MSDGDGVERLEELAEALGKLGVPARLRAADDGRTCLRASHPQVPLSTDVHVRSFEAGACFLSEWETIICPAANTAEAVAYIARLLDLRIS
ncbi:hypothetical protein [Actinomadura vinacea]|uniref:hypothetical protein n=1 Tax=Actinomadura vinacea TaxID=115336 RepID=UPI0031D48354